ncbi:MAG: dihydropteroate synthase [Flavobacteriaceae bacterium]|nr:dihydropteroate synthase [Flavobacteriaceae bacterium]
MNINCKGKLIDLSTPKVMGILNLTPDSFYDGGKYHSEKEILLHTEKMLLEGATFIDIGAYSSRPDAKHISEKEELLRLIPILETIIQHFPEIFISIDTFRSEVARQSVEIGACMINDISAGNLDKQMFKTIAKLQVPYIMMHMKGTPQSMQQNVIYNDLIKDIIYFFSKKINQLRALDVNDIILDVGFGFSKTLDQNYELLNNLNLFNHLELPILSGISRKSMLYKYLNISPEEALNATTVTNTIAILQGSNILRVHDVKEAIETIKIVNKLKYN